MFSRCGGKRSYRNLIKAQVCFGSENTAAPSVTGLRLSGNET
jgi:hypothetical protein